MFNKINGSIWYKTQYFVHSNGNFPDFSMVDTWDCVVLNWVFSRCLFIDLWEGGVVSTFKFVMYKDLLGRQFLFLVFYLFFDKITFILCDLTPYVLESHEPDGTILCYLTHRICCLQSKSVETSDPSGSDSGFTTDHT